MDALVRLGNKRGSFLLVLLALVCWFGSVLYCLNTTAESNLRISQKEEEIQRREDALQHREKELEKLWKKLSSASSLTDLPPLTEVIPTTKEWGADEPKRQKVKAAMEFAWNGYVERAWGKDELTPVDGHGKNWLGLGLTIVDALDTLWIMDMKDEFNRGKQWVADHLDFNKVIL